MSEETTILTRKTEHGDYITIHTPTGIVRLRITNNGYPGIENAVLQIMTGDGEAASMWFDRADMRRELADGLMLMVHLLRECSGG